MIGGVGVGGANFMALLTMEFCADYLHYAVTVLVQKFQSYPVSEESLMR